MRAVLQGYQGRYGALKDAVTETEPTFDDAVLEHDPGRRPAHRARLRARGALAPSLRWSSSGSGRTSWKSRGSGWRWSAGSASPSGCSATPSGSTRSARRIPAKSLAARFGAKEAVMKAMGVGLWKFKFRDVEVVRAKVGRPCRAAGPGRGDGRRAWGPGLAPLADAHRHHGHGGRDRARAEPERAAVLTPDEMAEADRRTIAAGTPVEVLMERAGTAVAWAVRRLLGGTYGRRAVVVCGKGNNGGDGLVTAQVLVGGACASTCSSSRAGVDRARFIARARAGRCAVDAMFGTGFRGALEGDARGSRRRCATRMRTSLRSTSRRVSTGDRRRCAATRSRAVDTVTVRRAEAGPLLRTGAQPRRVRSPSPTSAST